MVNNKKKKWLITGAVLVLLIFFELVFDVAEIMIGQLLLWSNSLRPKVGRLWVEDEKNQSGVQQVTELVDQTPEEEAVTVTIHTIEDLQQILSINGSYQLQRNDFIDFYNNLPRKESEQIISPFELISLTQNSNWQSTQFVAAGEQISVLFVDGYDTPIRDSFIAVNELAAESNAQTLDTMPELQGRIISAAMFLNAFNNMPVRYRQQVVNDAHRLASWLNGALQYVGISPLAKTDGVTLYFQVQTVDGIRIYPMVASELGAGYLINEINKMGEINIEQAKRESE